MIATTDVPAILDCGDPPTYTLGHRYDPLPDTVNVADQSTWLCRCGEHYLAHGIGTGYARTPDGRTLCYRHAEDAEVADFAAAEAWTGYVTRRRMPDDGKIPTAQPWVFTTWTGRELAVIGQDRWVNRGGHFGSSHLVAHVRAVGPDGSRWHGKYLPDYSEAVTLRRAKGSTR